MTGKPADRVLDQKNQLQKLKQQYLLSLPERIDQVMWLCESIIDSKWQRSVVDEITMELHRLTSASEAFHLKSISTQTHALERYLKMINSSDDEKNPQHYDHLIGCLEVIKNNILDGVPEEEEKTNIVPSTLKEKEALQSGCHILVVDDDRYLREYLSSLLTGMGHTVTTLQNGLEAVEQFSMIQPDVILMDVLMPKMNGYDAVRDIKLQCDDQYIPVVFLTALEKDDDLVKCIECGGDDFLMKPVNPVILGARLAALRRTQKLYQRLEVYHQQVAEEIALSQKVFKSIINRSPDILGIQYWCQSASNFLGDVLCYRRAPNGRLYIMIGDFTGHDLAAAIGAIPTADIFYRFALQDLGVSAIIREINRTLFDVLPSDKFCSVIVMAIDIDEMVMQIWNGGMPPVILRQQDNTELQFIWSKHPACGIFSDAKFDDHAERINLNGVASMIAHSDGVNEANNADAELLGLKTLHHIVQTTNADEDMLQKIQDKVCTHQSGSQQADDISLIEIKLSGI